MGYNKSLSAKVNAVNKAKDVDKSGESGIIKSTDYSDSDSLYYTITDDAIDSIPFVDVFDDAEMNRAYQEASKGLLREAKNHAVGTEISAVYDLNMEQIGEYTIGTRGKTQIANPSIPYHAFHNHGSGESFSPEDLIQLTLRPNQRSIAAVGNNANCYVMLKLENADQLGYYNDIASKMLDKSFFEGFSYVDLKTNSISISSLSEHQKIELKTKLRELSDKCSTAGENYGFKFIIKKMQSQSGTD